MRIRLAWLLAAVAAPALAQNPAPCPMNMGKMGDKGASMPCGMNGMGMNQGSALLEKMQGNVAKITDPAEKERWDANVALWQIATRMPPALSKADFDKMQAQLDIIGANVAKISAAAEKERWTANRDLWSLMVAGTGTFPSNDTVKLKSAFATLSKNVAKITAAGEKERWTANRDLWQRTIDRSSMRRSMGVAK